jgi:hypothetical protein
MDKIEWSELSNSEMEVKLKTLEFEYENVKNNINKQILVLDELEKSYIKGISELNKRISPSTKNGKK